MRAAASPSYWCSVEFCSWLALAPFSGRFPQTFDLLPKAAVSASRIGSAEGSGEAEFFRKGGRCRQGRALSASHIDSAGRSGEAEFIGKGGRCRQGRTLSARPLCIGRALARSAPALLALGAEWKGGHFSIVLAGRKQGRFVSRAALSRSCCKIEPIWSGACRSNYEFQR